MGVSLTLSGEGDFCPDCSVGAHWVSSCYLRAYLCQLLTLESYIPCKSMPSLFNDKVKYQNTPWWWIHFFLSALHFVVKVPQALNSNANNFSFYLLSTALASRTRKPHKYILANILRILDYSIFESVFVLKQV